MVFGLVGFLGLLGLLIGIGLLSRVPFISAFKMPLAIAASIAVLGVFLVILGWPQLADFLSMSPWNGVSALGLGTLVGATLSGILWK